MFDFDCVIDDGTYDDFKECVLAIVWLPPWNGVRKLNAHWTAEVDQDLVCFHSISAEAVLVKALKEAMKHERKSNSALRRKSRRDRPVDRRGGESVLHQTWV
jgi:hypothetical protein